MYVVALLGIAAISDSLRRKVPNGLILLGIAGGVGLAGYGSVYGRCLIAMGTYLFRLCLTMAVLFPLFRFRVIGAGDLKLMALIAACLGYSDGVTAIGCGFLVGAVWAAIKMFLTGNARERFSIFIAYFRRFFLTKEIEPYYQPERDDAKAVIPFAGCLFCGFLVFLLIK